MVYGMQVVECCLCVISFPLPVSNLHLWNGTGILHPAPLAMAFSRFASRGAGAGRGDRSGGRSSSGGGRGGGGSWSGGGRGGARGGRPTGGRGRGQAGASYEASGAYDRNRTRTPTGRGAQRAPPVRSANQLPAVRQEDHLIRRQVKPFVSKEGNSLYLTNRCKSDAEVLDSRNISATCTFMNCEWYNGRLGHASSFLGANLEEGATKILGLVPSKGDLPADAAKAFSRTGVLIFREFLDSEEGVAFREAAAYLNMSNDTERTPEEFDKALQTVFGALPRFARSFQNLALFSTKLLAMAMSALEAIAALEDRDRWAEELRHQLPMQTDEVKQFCRTPHDDQLLVDAIISRYARDFIEPNAARVGNLLDEDFEELAEEDVWGGFEEDGEEGDLPDDEEFCADLVEGGGARGGGEGGIARRLFGQREAAPSARPAERSAFGASVVRSAFGASARTQPQVQGARAKASAVVGPRLTGVTGSQGGATLPKAATAAQRSPALDASEWPIEEFSAFLLEAQAATSNAEIAALEAKSFKELIDRIPISIRKYAGLPVSAASYEIAQKNAEQTSNGISKLVMEVQNAFRKSGEAFVRSKTCKFGVEAALEDFGLLELLVKSDYLVNKAVVEAALREVAEAGDEETKADAVRNAQELQKSVIREQLFDYPVMLNIWERTLRFLEKHHSLEPSRQQVAEFIGLFEDEDLQGALEITLLSKIQGLKIKPREWRVDVGRVVSVAFLALDAWGGFFPASSAAASSTEDFQNLGAPTP
jgi:hypothetical protein